MAKDPDAKYEKGMSPKQKSAFKKQDAKNDTKLAKSVKASEPGPSLYLHGKHAETVHKTPVGKTVKMVVHAKVTNHGISTYDGDRPTASLEVQKMQPLGGRKPSPKVPSSPKKVASVMKRGK